MCCSQDLFCNWRRDHISGLPRKPEATLCLGKNFFCQQFEVAVEEARQGLCYDRQ